MNKRLALLIAAIAVFGGFFTLSAYKIVCYYSDAADEEDGFSSVAKAFEDARANAYAANISGSGDNVQSSDNESVQEPSKAKEADRAAVMAGYSALAENNPDFFGWIEIPGTAVNYPVTHTPDDPEKYLHKSFDGRETKSGTPFLAAECREGRGNYIIYAHNMKSGSMFASLMKYRKQSFWEEHKDLNFDTLSGLGSYRVIAAFYANISEKSDFKYFEYTDLTDEERFDEYLINVRENALYDTGERASFGLDILTLSTCTNRSDDERFVVVAVRTDQAE